ncbi:MAG: DeoR family transcriptional regulator [Candidatus Pacebacteria bacterium]|jgi:hypothetical protein|nr:DeoR family transcriptional regulator [Candidatus Paceibacterota bacterium]
MEYKRDTPHDHNGLPFPKDLLHTEARKSFYISLSQRAEKVSTAIYMITNHIDEKEAIRTSFRDAALALVLDVVSLEDPLRSVEETFQLLGTTTVKIESLLRISDTVGMVSTSNATILQKEIIAIREQCQAGQKFYALATLDDVLKNMYPETASDSQKKSETGDAVTQLLSETNTLSKKTDILSTEKNDNKINSFGVSTSFTERKEKILEIIKDKGEVSIKDISTDFQGCSEKTIQRDINALVDEGRIMKTGDRRWSRYSLRR